MVVVVHVVHRGSPASAADISSFNAHFPRGPARRRLDHQKDRDYLLRASSSVGWMTSMVCTRRRMADRHDPIRLGCRQTRIKEKYKKTSAFPTSINN